MADNHNVNAQISSIGRGASKELNSKMHSEDGIHFHSGVQAAPTDVYYGFINTGADTVITTITYIDGTKQSGTITGMTLFQGLYVSIPGLFSTITIASGNMILLKYIDKK